MAGGTITGSNGGPLLSAELYDPVSRTFSATGNLTGLRTLHTATLLADGKVLIAGGQGEDAFGDSELVSAAEVYDPASGTFSVTGSLMTPRVLQTATLLPNGKVLIAGGYNGSPDSLTSAELYDPVSGTFSATGSLTIPREHHTATLLHNGKVLIIGGSGPSPAYDRRTVVQRNGVSRHAFITRALLPNGKVLVAGGIPTASPFVVSRATAASGAFSGTASPGARELHTATLLLDGNVLIAGGTSTGANALSSAELYNVGLGYLESRRPVYTSYPSGVIQPAGFAVGGTRFRGDSEASGGSFNSSPTNYPLLQLQRIDNDQTLFIRPGSPWSDTSFTTPTLRTLANGHYRVTIVTNGIPTVGTIIVFTGAAAPAAPSLFAATATNTAQVVLSWSAVFGAGGYEVYRSTSLAGPYALAVTTNSQTTAIDSGLAANTTYLYKVRALGSAGPSAFTAIDPATTIVFTPSNLSGVGIQAVHFTQLGTAVTAMRAAAGLPAFAFTAPIPGTTVPIPRQHVIELRTALDAARSTLGLPSVVYTDAVITAGITTIKAAHLAELRAGTQ